jgi:hypothetical protein
MGRCGAFERCRMRMIPRRGSHPTWITTRNSQGKNKASLGGRLASKLDYDPE